MHELTNKAVLMPFAVARGVVVTVPGATMLCEPWTPGLLLMLHDAQSETGS